MLLSLPIHNIDEQPKVIRGKHKTLSQTKVLASDKTTNNIINKA